MSPEERTAAASAHLRARGLDLAALRDLVGRSGRPPAALLVGSTSFGCGNSLSDLDLMLVGAEDWSHPDQGLTVVGAYADVSVRLEGGAEVNLELWREAAIGPLRQRMQGFATDPRRPVPELEEWEYQFLHNLRAGVVVANPALVQANRDMFGTELLPSIALRRALDGLSRGLPDVWDLLEDGRPEAATFVLRDTMAELLRADLAAIGETEYRKKWGLRFLGMYEDTLGPEAVAFYRTALTAGPTDIPWPAIDAFIRKALDRMASARPDCAAALEEMGAGWRRPSALPVTH